MRDYPFLDRLTQTSPPHDPQRVQHALEDARATVAEIDNADLRRELEALLDEPTARALLDGVFGNSPFLTRAIIRDIEALPDLMAHGPEQTFARLLEDMASALDAAEDMATASAPLRITRRQVAALVALSDIGGLWSLEQVTDALSAFADAAISGAIRFLLRRAGIAGDLELADDTRPDHESGLIVLGMGKLGARELNYSSDVDLIVFFDPDKVRYHGRKTAQACLVKLVRDLVQLLQEPTADGYVLRVDLRLRPDPGATPVVISLQAAEQYYESMGQNWERAAMIKARPVAGDLVAGQAFLDWLQPFIWRRSLDFASIEDVHSIKRQIHTHRGHSDIAVAGNNIKLGRGGIRDIEFFVQTQQLIAGGRDASLRGSTTCGGMQALADAGWLAPDVVEELTVAYGFHRTLEHRLQMIADEQTQVLPKTPEGVDHLARFMGYRDTAAFEARVTAELKTVQRHYANLFESAPALSEAAGNLVFTGSEDDPDTLQTLSDMGYGEPEKASALVRGWHHGRYRCTRTQRSRQILTKLMPALLRALADTPNPTATFNRFDRFMEGLPAGIQLFSMLSAHPELLGLLAEIMGSAPRLADYLSRNPGVLDAVLSEDFFANLPDRGELAAGLQGGLRLSRDFQDVLDGARRWAKDRRFQLGVRSLRVMADTDTLGEEYSRVADTAIAALYPYVADEFAERERHGVLADAGMAVIGMGKLGSEEMTATSDLDLIFIYDFDESAANSDGERPLAASHYFTRLSQRLINAITAQTAEGQLYDVDMRLRPSGNAGPVATRLQGFVDYQRDQAWTWEHMALTRARVVSGPPALVGQIMGAIREVLTRPRDTAKTAADVVDMRRRVAKEKGVDDPWEVKHVSGGLLDIEFICQYLQLVHGAQHPDALHPNTCRALQQLAAAGAIGGDVASELVTASRLYRGVMGLLRVAFEGRFDPAQSPAGLRDALARTSGVDRFDDLQDLLPATQGRIAGLFASIVGAPD